MATLTRKHSTLDDFCNELKRLQVDGAEALTESISTLFGQYQQERAKPRLVLVI